jgi:hypothetical protein
MAASSLRKSVMSLGPDDGLPSKHFKKKKGDAKFQYSAVCFRNTPPNSGHRSPELDTMMEPARQPTAPPTSPLRPLPERNRHGGWAGEWKVRVF